MCDFDYSCLLHINLEYRVNQLEINISGCGIGQTIEPFFTSSFVVQNLRIACVYESNM